jgi:hypothetical protein
VTQGNRALKAWLVCVLASVLGLLCGCSKDSSSLSSHDKKAFDSASPELKQMWQTALDASRTNDFEGAKTLLYNLARSDITPDQQQAVKRALTELDQKFTQALEKGDPAAKQALEALQKNPPNRGR